MIKVTAKSIRKANVDFKNLVRNQIRKEKLIDTGTMIRSITSDIKVVNGEVEITLGAVYYYKFLDDGTRYIKAYNITEDVINTKKFKDIIMSLVTDMIDVGIKKALKPLTGASYES